MTLLSAGLQVHSFSLHTFQRNAFNIFKGACSKAMLEYSILIELKKDYVSEKFSTENWAMNLT